MEMDGIGLIHQPIARTYPHNHNFWEFVYYLEGEGEIIIGDARYPFASGVFGCLPPHIPHYELSMQPFRNYHLAARFVVNTRNEPVFFRDNEDLDFRHLFGLLYKDYHAGRKAGSPLASALLGALLYHMNSQPDNEQTPPDVERLQQLLLANLSNAVFSVEAALGSFACSPDYLRREFRNHYKLSPLAYLTEKRISHAKDLLALGGDPGYRIGEISEMCGYEDPYYFSRLFKKITGLSPGAWRANR